jgi:hypothetical protein
VIVVLAIPACGAEDERLSRDDYQAALIEIVEDSAEPTGLYTDLVVERLPEDECAGRLGTFEEQVDALVERVAALQPPAGVAEIHDEFVAHARESVERVGQVRMHVADGELSCGDELNDALYGMPSSNRAERAIARLEKHGYFVFGD